MIVDEIPPDDSVSRVGSSRVSGSLTHLVDLTARKKHVVLEKQLYEAEADAQAEREWCKADRVQAEAEAEAAQKMQDAKAELKLDNIDAEIE